MNSDQNTDRSAHELSQYLKGIFELAGKQSWDMQMVVGQMKQGACEKLRIYRIWQLSINDIIVNMKYCKQCKTPFLPFSF